MLLDGGLATQLEAQGCNITNSLWSASLLKSDPQAIIDAHVAYLEAGAQCLSTASYQASRQGFARLGLGARDADALMLTSVELARAATTQCESDASIAASLGPYGAMLHDGSEYSGNYEVADDVIADFHQPRLALFDEAGVDVLMLETIPSLREAKFLAAMLIDCATPSWISFSCKDELHISDGTPLQDVARLFANHPKVRAIGINCTPPQHIAALIGEIRAVAPDKAIVVYPNSGESYVVGTNSWSGLVTPFDAAREVQKWLRAGATIVGGCCRIGPAHIAAMASAIFEEGS